MAPKRGGSYGSSFSSSSSSCDACDAPLPLANGYTWSDSYPRAYIAFLVIGLIAMIVALVGATKSRWQRKGKIDTLREILFPCGIVAIILFFICEIVNTALTSSTATVTYIYYILYIFEELFLRVAEVIIFFVAYRAIREYLCQERGTQQLNVPSQARTPMSALDTPFRIVSIIALVIYTLLTIAGFGCYTAILAIRMINVYSYYSRDSDLQVAIASLKIGFTYAFIFLIWTVIATVFVLLKLKGRSRSIVPYILLLVTTLSLFVFQLVSAIFSGLSSFEMNSKFKVRLTTGQALNFIYILMHITAVLALIALSTDKIRHKGVVNPSLAPNNNFVGNGTYGNNMANNMHGQGYIQQQPVQQYQAQPVNKHASHQAPSEMSGTTSATATDGFTPYPNPHGQPQQQFTPSPPPGQQQQTNGFAPNQHQYPVPQQPQMSPASPPPQQLYTTPPPIQGYAQQPQNFSHQ